MFDNLLNILKSNKTTGKSKPEDNEFKIRIAAAVLLLEASYADDECSPDELQHIHATVKETFGLSDKCAEELLELASTKRENEVDIWQFTNKINQESSHQEKITIMETVWQIIYVDGKLDSHEDHFAHKLANLLRLTHEEMIAAKLKAKNEYC